MIHAGVSELRSAFNQHRSAVLAEVRSKNLLLFYAAECGLKAAWLTRNRLRSTSQLEPDLLARGGHDLMLWVERLKLPAMITKRSVRFRLRRDNAAHEIALAHQAWRYGVELVATDQADVVAWLDDVCRWAREELQR